MKAWFIHELRQLRLLWWVLAGVAVLGVALEVGIQRPDQKEPFAVSDSMVLLLASVLLYLPVCFWMVGRERQTQLGYLDILPVRRFHIFAAKSAALLVFLLVDAGVDLVLSFMFGFVSLESADVIPWHTLAMNEGLDLFATVGMVIWGLAFGAFGRAGWLLTFGWLLLGFALQSMGSFLAEAWPHRLILGPDRLVGWEAAPNREALAWNAVLLPAVWGLAAWQYARTPFSARLRVHRPALRRLSTVGAVGMGLFWLGWASSASEPQGVQVERVTFDERTVRTESHVGRFTHTPRQAARVARLAPQFDEQAEHLARVFEVPLDVKIPISLTSPQAHVIAGTAEARRIDVDLDRVPDGEGLEVLLHEWTHLLVARRSKGQAPSVLMNEGLADWVAKDRVGRDLAPAWVATAIYVGSQGLSGSMLLDDAVWQERHFTAARYEVGVALVDALVSEGCELSKISQAVGLFVDDAGRRRGEAGWPSVLRQVGCSFERGVGAFFSRARSTFRRLRAGPFGVPQTRVDVRSDGGIQVGFEGGSGARFAPVGCGLTVPSEGQHLSRMGLVRNGVCLLDASAATAATVNLFVRMEDDSGMGYWSPRIRVAR